MSSLICSITSEEIKIAGMTVLGNVYEYSSIKEWLKDHSTDPLTNEYLPTKFIVNLGKVDNKLLEEIDEKKSQIRETTKMWAGWIPNQIYQDKSIEALKIKNYLKSLTGEELEKWNQYQEMKKTQFFEKGSNEYYLRVINYHNQDESFLDKDDNLERPTGTGHGFQFIDLSKNMIIKDKLYKSTDFTGSDLSNIKFADCDFSRCVFINSILNNTVFINCTFIGEDITFLDSHTNAKTTFISCVFEKADTWKRFNNPKDVKEILLARKLKMPFNVL